MSPIENGPESYSDRFAAGDDVARLVRLAGPRPTVPVDDMNIAREAARAEWRRQVRSRRRRTVSARTGGWLVAATVLLAVGVTLWQWLQVAPVATLEVASGAVTLVPPPVVPASEGAELLSGTLVDTGDARATLRMAGGQSVRLDAGTRLRLVSRSALALEGGAVYVDSGADVDGAFEVRTPFGVARDIGTQFEVRLTDDRLSVKVREGTVVLTRDGEAHTATAGIGLEVDADGNLTRSTVARHGPLWEWVVAMAPGFDTEGRSVRELLEWASREAGLELRFADEEAAAQTETPLLGSVGAALKPDEAIAVSVPATGLAYRIDDGVLWIER